jgi:hypothetical protein
MCGPNSRWLKRPRRMGHAQRWVSLPSQGRHSPNISLNSRFARSRPSSVNTTDFTFADGIEDHPFVVQATEHIPIEALPGTIIVVQRQIEQRQRGIVDLVLVDGHREPLVARC